MKKSINSAVKSPKAVKSVSAVIVPEVFKIVDYHAPDVDCPQTVDHSASMFFSFLKVIKMFATKIRKSIVKRVDTFVAACYREYLANTLTEAKYKEIAEVFGAALHRHKEYVKYFNAGKYVVA